MPVSQTNILIFDSGVGGLSIADHIRALMPSVSIDYLADNALFPYGLLEDEQLIERTCSILKQAITIKKPNLIVIACNSASTIALPAMRESLEIPVVGVVPAIKPAANLSKSKIIGLLATPGTVIRNYTDELIGEFAKDCEIVKVGSSELVQLVEEKIAGKEISEEELKIALKPLLIHPQWKNMDTIVLACTHFPLIKQELANLAPHIKCWVDSGEAVARRVESLLPASTITHSESQNSQARFTALNKLNAAQKQHLLKFGFAELQQL